MLEEDAPKELLLPPSPLVEGRIIESAEIYRLYFHGPAYQVIERAWWDGHQIVGLMAQNLPSNNNPSEPPTLLDPRLIELCFQTAGIWEMGIHGRMGLPLHIDRVSFWKPCSTSLETRFYAVVVPDLILGTFVR